MRLLPTHNVCKCHGILFNSPLIADKSVSNEAVSPIAYVFQIKRRCNIDEYKMFKFDMYLILLLIY